MSSAPEPCAADPRASVLALARRLRGQPPAAPGSAAGELQALLHRLGWKVRVTTRRGAPRILLHRTAQPRPLIEISLEQSRPDAGAPISRPVPVVRLSAGLPAGLASLGPAEAHGLQTLTTALRSLDDDGTPRAPVTTRYAAVEAAPPAPEANDPELEQRIAVIRAIGHFGTALTGLVLAGHTRNLGWEDCLAAWRDFRRRAEAGLCLPTLGLYVHVPVCVQRCTYCQIPVRAPATRHDVAALTAALDWELDRYASVLAGYPLQGLSVGGGTPSLLSEAQTARLLDHVFSIFRRAPGFHGTVDLSPQTTTLRKLKLWRDAGVSRVCFGVQTLTEAVLRRIRRAPQGPETVARAIAAARAAGVEGVSVDLVAGLPGETEASFLKTLKGVVALLPDQIQIYRWVLEPKCEDFETFGPMNESRLAEREELLSAARDYLETGPRRRQYKGEPSNCGLEFISTRADLYHVMAHYEALRSTRASILGVGHGAFSVVHGALDYGHQGSLDDYLAGPEGRVGAPFTGSLLSRTFDLACDWAKSLDAQSVNRGRFRSDFGQSPEEAFPSEIAYLVQRGWLRLEGDDYRVPPGVGREETIVAGALMFSLPELESARALQLTLERETTARPRGGPEGRPEG